jgi:hypothetical protein
MVLVTTASASKMPDPPQAPDDTLAGFAPGGIDLKSKWVLNPATGTFTHTTDAAPTDPNQYKYELQCHLGSSDFDTVCLRYQIECKNGPDGKDGIPVMWLSAPKGVPNPVWSIHSGPTCLFDPKPEDLLPRIAADIQRQFQSLPVNAGGGGGPAEPAHAARSSNKLLCGRVRAAV